MSEPGIWWVSLLEQQTAIPKAFAVREKPTEYLDEWVEVIEKPAYDKLMAEYFKLKNLYLAANHYIKLTPCDPDITGNQWEAWQEYERLQKTVNIEAVLNASY